MGTSRLLCHLEPSPLGTKLGAYTLARKLATVSPLDLLRKDVNPIWSRMRLVWFRFRRHRTLKKKRNSGHPPKYSGTFWPADASERGRSTIVKTGVFEKRSPKHSVLQRKIDVLGFWGQSGEPDDDMNFGRPKKDRKNIEFLICFFNIRPLGI